MRTFVRYERIRRERKWRIIEPRFYDPFWFVNGSEPEKMVMAELVRRGIYFEFRAQNNTLGGFVDPTWEADILITRYKIWIEVQGAYFHTLPGQLKTDAFRYAAIKAAGWRPLFWWEWDIRGRLNSLMDEVPEFYHVDKDEQKGKKTEGLPFLLGSNVDQLKGLRTANQNRTGSAGGVTLRRVVRPTRRRK